MEGLNFYSDQRVLLDHVNFEQTARVSSTKKRLSDLWTDGAVKGKYSDLNVSIDAITSTLLNVGQGIGYANGERIAVTSDQAFDVTAPQQTTSGVATPQSTGNRAVTLADYTAGTFNYIWIQYLQTIGGAVTINPADGSAHYIEGSDGYQVVVTTTNPPENADGITNGLFLARVTANGVGSAITGLTDLLSRKYSQISVLDAITSSALANNSVTTGKIVDSAVTEVKVADGAITHPKVSTNAISYSNMKVGSVRGSTDNDGGSAREVQPGSISTPDLRDGAVTQYVQAKDTNTYGGGTTIHTVGITSYGGPITVTAHASIYVAVNGANAAELVIAVFRNDSGGLSLEGSRAMGSVRGVGAASNVGFNLASSVIDAPVPGYYTYTLKYDVAVGTYVSTYGSALHLVEHRK